MAKELKFLVPWGHVAAKAWGSPKGRPVLCVHGWLDNANTFDRLIPLLPKDSYYMAIDLGGHGLSSHRPIGFPYHFMDYLNDVRRVTAALSWKEFTIMGHSMGGTVANLFSCVFPELVEKLILLDSYGFYPSTKDYVRGLKLQRNFNCRDALSSLEEWKKILKSNREIIEDQLTIEDSQLYSPKVQSPQKALQRLLDSNCFLTEESGKILLQRGTTEVPGGLVYNRDVRALLRNHPDVPLDPRFIQEIQAEVLMIIAQDGLFTGSCMFSTELVVPIQAAYRKFLKERFQYAEVTGNHFVHLNEPEVVAGIINKFLNKEHCLKASL